MALSVRKVTNGMDPDLLDREIRDLGVRVKVFKSTICPNITSLETIDHDLNCEICNNNMIDFAPQETIALFQQQDFKEEFKIKGTFDIDEVQATFPSGITLFQFARIELLDFEEDFTELIQRQEGDIDRLKYSACTVLGLFIADKTVVTSGRKREFHFGVDFELTSTGDIKWISSNRPDERQIYSIYYRHHPVFRAVSAIHRDRYSQFNLRPEKIKSPKVTRDIEFRGNKDTRTFVKLPETWVIKRDYLLERRDAEGNLLPRNKFFDPNESQN